MGESPYPRRSSATGLAFEDGRAAVMFGNDGYFGAGVDASLRTILKAWFVATGRLECDSVGKEHVKDMTKEGLVQDPTEIFRRGRESGWLWLNAAPGFFFTGDDADRARQIAHWSPLIQGALRALQDEDGVKSVLMGDLAREAHRDVAPDCVEAVHPGYRYGGRAFIGNQEVQALLRNWRCLIET